MLDVGSQWMSKPNTPGGGSEHLHDKDLSNYINFLNRPTAVKTMSCQASVTVNATGYIAEKQETTRK